MSMVTIATKLTIVTKATIMTIVSLVTIMTIFTIVTIVTIAIRRLRTGFFQSIPGVVVNYTVIIV